MDPSQQSVQAVGSTKKSNIEPLMIGASSHRGSPNFQVVQDSTQPHNTINQDSMLTNRQDERTPIAEAQRNQTCTPSAFRSKKFSKKNTFEQMKIAKASEIHGKQSIYNKFNSVI